MITIIFAIGMMIVMSIVIAKACDGFEVATDYLGRNMSEGIKGATLNAIGSSMPELLTTVWFLWFATKTELGYNLAASIGGDTGSAVFNSIVIPALIIIVVLVVKLQGVTVNKKVILKDGLFLIGAEVLLLVLLSSDIITPMHGWIFTGFYLIYLAFTLGSNRKPVEDDDAEEDEEPENGYERFVHNGRRKTLRAWMLLLATTAFIGAACAGLVHFCEQLSIALNINMLFVSLVLVAAASSVPDTIISMKDARKGNSTDALTNVLGSNIFDITISMGLPLAVYLTIMGINIDFTDAGPTLIDIRIILLTVTVLTIGIFVLSKTLGKLQVVLLTILYTIFILYAVGAAQYHAGVENVLSETIGSFIEYFNSSLGETLRNTANSITKNW